MTDVAVLSVTATENGVIATDKALIGLAASAVKAENATGRFTAAQIKAASTGVNNFNAAMSAQAAAVAKTSPLMRKAGVEMNQYGMHTANVFSQLNDIGVMMASGQNPFVMALQQGTQLNQVWGQMGGKVGAIGAVLRGAFMSLLNPINLVTIGVIAAGAAIVNWFSSGSESVKTFDQSLDDVWQSVNAIQEQQKLYSTEGIQSLIDKYGELNQETLEFINLQTQALNREALESVRASITALRDETAGWGSEISGLADIFPGIAGQVNHMAIAMNDAMDATNTHDQLAAVTRLREKIIEVTGGIDKMSSAQFTFFTKVQESEDALKQLAASAPQANWMNGAIMGVNSLIGRIGAAITANAALASANQKASMRSGVYGAIGARGDPRTQGASAGQSNTFTANNFAMPSGVGGGTGGGGSGGGGGGSDPYQANLDRLVTSLMTERETVEKWYADNEVILNDNRAKEILGAQGHKDAMLDLERQYHEKLRGIRDESDAYGLGATAKYFGDLNTLAGGGYEGLLRAQKTFAASQALVNTYLAASQALADPSLSFFAKFAAVARVIGAGMGLVNAIKGGGKSGGGTGGGASSSGDGAAPKEPDRVTTVDFQGDPFMVAIAESVFKQMYAASGNGRILIKA